MLVSMLSSDNPLRRGCTWRSTAAQMLHSEPWSTAGLPETPPALAQGALLWEGTMVPLAQGWALQESIQPQRSLAKQCAHLSASFYFPVWRDGSHSVVTASSQMRVFFMKNLWWFFNWSTKNQIKWQKNSLLLVRRWDAFCPFKHI